MSMKRSTSRNAALRITLSAVLAALSLVFLYMASFAPSGKLGLVAMAGLFPAAAVVSFGFSAGFLCYAGTGVLALILLADKGMVLLYLLFFGLYPMIKGRIEEIRILPLEFVLKLIVCNAILTIFLLFMGRIFFAAMPLENLPKGLVYAICNGAFLIYDYGFSKIIGFYCCRIDRVLRKA